MANNSNNNNSNDNGKLTRTEHFLGVWRCVKYFTCCLFFFLTLHGNPVRWTWLTSPFCKGSEKLGHVLDAETAVLRLLCCLPAAASVSRLDASRPKEGFVCPATLGMEECYFNACSFLKAVPSCTSAKSTACDSLLGLR